MELHVPSIIHANEYMGMVNELAFDYKAYQARIQEIDDGALRKHNERHAQGTPYHFEVGMTPCPFEGNLLEARVILLLANPQFIESSTPADHNPDFAGYTDWGIWGLSLQSNKSIHEWWRNRLRTLVDDPRDEEQWRELSGRMASLQVIPWASKKFHDANGLPSKMLMAQTVKALVEHDPTKIFIVMRQRRFWEIALHDTPAALLYTKNSRASYVTERNLRGSDAWNNITETVNAGLTKEFR